MIPFAAANRVRLIFVNRRDYPGSTPFSDAELAELGSSDLETRAKALAQQGLDIGLFLAWLIRETNIPPVVIGRDGKQQGGIALVAWSLAHTPVAGFLAHADSLPTDALRILDPCLRAYCIFGEHTNSSPSPAPLTAHRAGYYPARCATRLIRTSDAQQVPPLGRTDVSDGRTRPALLLLGVDILHTFGSRS
jgi:hypothetical protein